MATLNDNVTDSQDWLPLSDEDIGAVEEGGFYQLDDEFVTRNRVRRVRRQPERMMEG